MRPVLLIGLACLANGMTAGLCELPPVPVPPENPITDSKRLLGKILFWDEQLSSDDSIACGTCHRPASGGADPRSGIFPGERPGTIDDVAGSPGIRRLDELGNPVDHPIFGDQAQITSRLAPSIFGALWADEIFWDGRAGGTLIDPASGNVLIASGAALENQVLMTLASPVEMAKPGRTWDELRRRLELVAPLALADNWPPDVQAAIARHGSYPSLFEAAYGDSEITAARIAMAIATYERTLVADQTRWDQFQNGDATALDQFELRGWRAFQALRCTSCHQPPLFTTNDFANIGLRRSEIDPGRGAITQAAGDSGDMKIPSLRNAGLRRRFMHTGEFASVGAAVAFYREAAILPDVDEIPEGGPYTFNISAQTAADIQSFLFSALTDDRAADETFPFDRPRLASEHRSP